MSSIELHDAMLEFDDSGTGNAVVLLHGFPLARSFWRQQVDVFCETHRVIVPDLRGHGHSSVSRGTASMSVMAADVIAILDACEIDKATICGLSMGGYVAWELWRQYSHRLSALVLCNTRAAADNETVARARHRYRSVARTR